MKERVTYFMCACNTKQRVSCVGVSLFGDYVFKARDIQQ